MHYSLKKYIPWKKIPTRALVFSKNKHTIASREPGFSALPEATQRWLILMGECYRGRQSPTNMWYHQRSVSRFPIGLRQLVREGNDCGDYTLSYRVLFIEEEHRWWDFSISEAAKASGLRVIRMQAKKTSWEARIISSKRKECKWMQPVLGSVVLLHASL